MGIWESFIRRIVSFRFDVKGKGLKNTRWRFRHPETILRNQFMNIELKVKFSPQKLSTTLVYRNIKKGTKMNKKVMWNYLHKKITFRMVPGGERKWELMDKNLSRNAINVEQRRCFTVKFLKFNRSCNALKRFMIFSIAGKHKKCN